MKYDKYTKLAIAFPELAEYQNPQKGVLMPAPLSLFLNTKNYSYTTVTLSLLLSP